MRSSSTKVAEWPLERGLYGEFVRDVTLSRLLAVFAAAALGLSVIGVYGGVSYFVVRRRYEVGVRLALGAPPAAVVAIVLRRAVLLIGAGLALGVGLAWLSTRIVESLLFGVHSREPLLFLGTALLLGIIAVLAAIGPAVRAARTDPQVVLRGE